MTKTQLAFLAIGFVASIRGQSVGPDNITTMATATCTTTGTQTYAFIDAASTVYQYMCGGGAGGAVLTNIPSASGIRSWQDCFDWCDNTTVGANGCSGFLYVSRPCLPKSQVNAQIVILSLLGRSIALPVSHGRTDWRESSKTRSVPGIALQFALCLMTSNGSVTSNARPCSFSHTTRADYIFTHRTKVSPTAMDQVSVL